jgi:hypothetical protein
MVADADRRFIPHDTPIRLARPSGKCDDPAMPEANSEMNCGPQPLDQVMDGLGLANHALVERSDAHLTHKVVQKARRGRRLTPNSIGKIVAALNAAAPREPAWTAAELFNYVKPGPKRPA